MISVDSVLAKPQTRSQKPWPRSILWTHRGNRRVTPLGTIFLWQQSVVALMRKTHWSSQNLHSIVSINQISNFQEASLEPLFWPYPPASQYLKCKLWPPRECNDGSWPTIPTIKLSSQSFPDVVNESPKGGVSILRAECKCCETSSRRCNASNQSTYPRNDEKLVTRNQAPWWLALVVCIAKRGATESHGIVFREIWRLQRLH